MFNLKKVKGKILYSCNIYYLIARGLDVYKCSFSSGKCEIYCNLGKDLPFRFIYHSSLFRRLLRKGVHHYVKTSVDEIFFYNNRIFSLSKGISLEVNGNRPLSVCSNIDGDIYYGSYHSNKDRKRNSYVYVIDALTFNQSVYCEFSKVRHIHGVFYDKFEKRLCVTTGDVDFECGIWEVNYHKEIKLIVGGGQQERAVDLQFTSDYIYYGTDSPVDKNYIYKLSRASGEKVKLCEVSSSIFYSGKVTDCFYFSTVVEPSDINISKKVELWKVSTTDECDLIYTFNKDSLPLKLFQYGQLTFPFNESEYLSFYLQGVNGDGYSYISI